ncbi:uncharacterized protein Yka (UPF0111/DUF47 family) [Peptoniphilus koenoeneniae]|uniref:Uncharacterized protein Yka (UPF0111/DUF47 family) n=1 Tax=Peptoniphilus koenoeneniae TaxID=507751 RepID=A0ABU0AVV0_9FIRM|nr:MULTISPECIES: YvrJ family protein [Peptoniphilus]ERT57965.1 YvrJ family protein [Peptoniphilus sp. BV3C26]MDQ0275387.1 uncharacterized protein Yka (UPF0111/DUF47 family) [Peptoniphilus koenoeneniae]
MEELISQIANIGFPMAVSVFLLVRIESKITELSDSIKDLSNNISLIMRK